MKKILTISPKKVSNYVFFISWELRNYKMLKSEEVLWKVSVNFIVFKIKSIIWQECLFRYSYPNNQHAGFNAPHASCDQTFTSFKSTPSPPYGWDYFCMYVHVCMKLGDGKYAYSTIYLLRVTELYVHLLPPRLCELYIYILYIQYMYKHVVSTYVCTVSW